MHMRLGIHPAGPVLSLTGTFTHAVMSDDDLAAFLAYEIGHIFSKYLKETNSSRVIGFRLTTSSTVIHALAEKIGFAESGDVSDPLNIPILGFLYLQRAQEKGADCINMLLVANAGFDPSAADTWWKEFDEQT